MSATRAWNSTLPQRTTGLPRGKGFSPRATGLPTRTPLRARSILGAGDRAVTLRATRQQRPRGRRETGFSAAVRLLIRARAGNGSPADAMCEACGIWLGEHGGQIQHIYARSVGGSRGWLYRSAANGALLCGTVYTGDHSLCEARDPHMEAMGFWRKRNTREKPGDYPIMLHGESGGLLKYLTPDGHYADTRPEGVAA